MRGLSPEQRRGLLLSIGRRTGIRALSPKEVAEAFKDATDAGMSKAELASSLHLQGQDMVGRFLRLLNLSPDKRYLIGWGNTGTTLSFSAATDIAGLSDRADQDILIDAALEHGFTGSEVREAIQIQRRARKPLPEAITDVLNRRPRIVRRHVMAGLVSDQNVRSNLRTMTQQQRDTLFRQIIATSLRNHGIESSRLGTDRFMLSGGDRMKLEFQGRDFESQINDLLVNELAA